MFNGLITFENPKSRAAEAFRTLRTNIQFSSIDGNTKTIVVTSTAPGEGKSTVISNLAMTMAQSGKKTILIDCDLRKPTVHKKLDIPNQNGLTSVLSGAIPLKDALFNTTLPNFHVLTSGPIPPNPSELLGSKKMRALVKDLEQIFDVILLDSPPVVAVTDAQVLSTLCQGVILVASYGSTQKIGLVRAKDLLKKVEANILGVVINKVHEKNDHYYYGKYYGSYYSEEGKAEASIEDETKK
jgi:capsular exopolysaccharide synthesis family protein